MGRLRIRFRAKNELLNLTTNGTLRRREREAVCEESISRVAVYR